jgi:hypothetical protein
VFNQRIGALIGGLTRVETTITVPPGVVTSARATCPPGQGVVSGGTQFISGGGTNFIDETVGSRNSWVAGGDNFGISISARLTAVAYCAPTGKAVTASNVAYARDREEAAVTRQKAMHGL